MLGKRYFSSSNILIKEALCLFLVRAKPRKLQKNRKQENGVMVSTHTRGAVISISSFKGFPRACTLGYADIQFHAFR